MVPHVREQQDHAVGASVTLLEREAALDRLQVSNVRLGIDADAAGRAIDAGVPRAKIDGTGQRHFDHRDLFCPGQVIADAGAEPAEQRHLSGVSHGSADRKRTGGQLEADRLEDLCRTDNREVRRLSADDAGDLTRTKPERASDRGVAGAVGDPRSFCLTHQCVDGRHPALRSPRQWSATRGHGANPARVGCTRAYRRIRAMSNGAAGLAC